MPSKKKTKKNKSSTAGQKPADNESPSVATARDADTKTIVADSETETITADTAKEELDCESRLKEEAEAEAQHDMQVAFIKLMNGVQEAYSVDDGDQTPVSGDAAQKLKWKWANGLDWNPSNPLMSNWMRVLAVGDYDGMLKEIEATTGDKISELIERRETLYRMSALFHVIKGATRTLNEAGTQYVETAKFVDKSKVPKHFQCALKLIELGACVNARDMLGATPLFYCTMRLANVATMRIAKLLVDNGANVNAVNRLGETALVQPLLSKRLDCVKFLLKYGIDPTVRDNEGASVEALFKMDKDFQTALDDHTNLKTRTNNSFASETSLCPLCDQPSRNRCTGCYIMRYCSKECQLAHWKKHKKVCKKTQGRFKHVHLTDISGAAEEVPVLPKDNFIVKVHIVRIQADEDSDNMDEVNEIVVFYDNKTGLLGGITKAAEGVSDIYTQLVEKLKVAEVESAYFQAVVDKENKLKVDFNEYILNQDW